MKLFTIGPVEMYDDIMAIGGRQVPYFRNDEFSAVMFKTAGALKKLLNAGDKAEIITLTASGTGAMEATVVNCFSEKDRLLVIDGGSFGHRFTELCDIHNIPYDAVKLEWGQTLSYDMLSQAAKGRQHTGLLVNLHESSTGQLYDLAMLSQYCKDNDLIFIADAISTFLADEVDMLKYGIDAIILSSQKALSLAPGLSFIALSERLLKDRIYDFPPRSMYFDFNSYILNGKRGQTPFTPAVRLVYELDAMLDKIESWGMNNIIARTAEIAADFRKKLKAIGLGYPEYPLSNACTPVIFPDSNAHTVYERLKDEYGIVVNPSGGVLGDKTFRVAHIGNHSLQENDEIINALVAVLKEQA